MPMPGMILEVMSRPGPKAAMASLGILSCVGWLGVLAGYYLSSEPTLPAQPVLAGATGKHARDVIGSDGSERIPTDQRIAWVDQRVRKMSETEDQARRRSYQDMREVMRERIDRDADAFHRLPESERTAFLDKQIDEMQRFMDRVCEVAGAPAGTDRPTGPGGSGKARGSGGSLTPPPGGPAQTGAQMTNMPADRRARVHSFMRAMGRRMAQRGLLPEPSSGS